MSRLRRAPAPPSPVAAALALGAALLGPAAAQGAEIRALGGTWDEQVSGIREEGGRLVLRTPQRALPLDEVKSVRFQDAAPARADRRGVAVLLTTGDVVRGTLQGWNDAASAVGVDSPGLGERVVSLELVRALLHDVTPERERELERGLEARAELDRVRLKDGGAAAGSIVRVDGGQVVVDTDRPGGTNIGTVRFDLDKVELVSIAPLDDPPAPPPGLRVVVHLVDGSSLRGRLVGMSPEKLELAHPLGGKDPLELAVARVRELTVQNGVFVYLSDLDPRPPVEQRFPPEFTYEPEVWGWRRDRAVTGGPLKLGGRTFEKGLGVHSYCALTYELGGEFAQLRATIGLDDSTRWLGEPGFGAVVFKVLVDGKPCREHPTGVVQKKGAPPAELVVDVTGAQSVTLVADFDPTSLHVLGRANWADAHLIKKGR